MNTQPYYPIGIQDFCELRSLNAVYVDKTELVYKLTHTSKFVFLSRPRRFGKSLLSSTFEYYFEGRKELFTGLAIESLEKDWIKHPVLHFDLSPVKGKPINQMKESIGLQLEDFEEEYGVTKIAPSLGDRLTKLIKSAYNQTGQKVVVLFDEYDAPILDVLHNDEKREEIRELLREFYSPLKMCDRYLRFVFITGISMFSQLSIFSELNNLDIISNDPQYASICGITEQELLDNFQTGIENMALDKGCSKDELVAQLKSNYDGYHFAKNSEGLYNPFSLLNAFKKNNIGSYWFRSGTPRALVEMLKRYQLKGEFDINNLDNSDPIPVEKFESPLEAETGPIPLLYQAGYLTIKDYLPVENKYILGIPNSEVRVGLLQNLLPLFSSISAGNAIDVRGVADDVSVALFAGDIDKAMNHFKSVLSSIPFMKGDKDILADIEKTEAYYHRIFYFFFRMLSNQVYAEVRSAKGACDVVITTPKYIYVVEIKIDSTPETALQQIEEKGYATPYLTDGREVTKIGINFSTETRTVNRWIVAQARN
jgi:hypothetical protein